MAIDKSKKVRTIITISHELKNYYDNLASEFGISTSALMSVALKSYKEEREALDRFKDMNKVIQYLQQNKKMKGGTTDDK